MKQFTPIIKIRNKTNEYIKKNIRDQYYTKGGKPKCPTCGKPMKRVIDSKTKELSKYEWELNCECLKKYPKLKELRMVIG